MNRIVLLEPEALAVCQASSKPPFLFQLPPEEGRKILDKAQDAPVYKCPASVQTLSFDAGKWGTIPVHVLIPEGTPKSPSVIFYIHGAGWVFGNLHTHDKLVRELAARTGSILVFPEYSLSPEARYPVAIEQCYQCLCDLPELLKKTRPDANLKALTVAGDSVGGNMASVMTILAKYRKGPPIQGQLLYYPVTNAFFNTRSYNDFSCGYYLYRAGMKWFWNHYTCSEKERNQITASPLRASCEQLKGLPPAMILNGEADVLRDEGEAYAQKLRKAGVPVTALRFAATIHDFVMLNSLDQSEACRAAMDASTAWVTRMNFRE